jgi:Mn-containing catalase
MVFDSSGTLRYDAHVSDGQVVDSYGNPIDGCYVNENGNVVDAYWNEIDPATGQLAQ